MDMNTSQIFQQIQTVLADYDAKVLQGLIESIPARRGRN
jgi:hypothetical protein